ncbi:epoxide hydrolase N-terminal domain-containing protein [Rhodococcus ruber]|uniref:epoxide hydrolase N-terminal domain-containing protein n=1 Tax=Rhodococcus ruber TaxID=1830 RepID=UPI003B20CDAF
MGSGGGQRIRYLHVRSSRADSTPILLCHGWPGYYLELLDLVPLLTEPDDADLRAFDVIVPSVPGFAFPHHCPTAVEVLAHVTCTG